MGIMLIASQNISFWEFSNGFCKNLADKFLLKESNLHNTINSIASRSESEEEEKEERTDKRVFRPYGNGTYLFIQMGAYRGGETTFAVIGLVSKPLHVFGKPGFECEWIPRNSTLGPMKGKIHNILPDWGYGRVYTVVVLNSFITIVFTLILSIMSLTIFLMEPYKTKACKIRVPDHVAVLFEWSKLRKVLDPWIEAGRVTLQDIRDQEQFDGYYHNQFLIVNDCLHRYKFMAKWTFSFDVDEFLYVPGGSSIDSVVQRFSDFTQFTIEQYLMSNRLCLELENSENYSSEWGFEKLHTFDLF
ncbi:galactan beta-1,4-galactosyltransferase GALS1-like [Cryptomeria japonica]|uniref:galactan beta-1,4-galactosyltransferase GALS1-like n=1 Tax=Cryptomeria japonica TaxID=3369 RepID=UPI0027D9D63B|nr:galactan beta-1,4-galactosyltransferase GALS1-like [Cryptomeria japonica]